MPVACNMVAAYVSIEYMPMQVPSVVVQQFWCPSCDLTVAGSNPGFEDRTSIEAPVLRFRFTSKNPRKPKVSGVLHCGVF